MNDEYVLVVDDDQELTLVGETPMLSDYNLLHNKPKINSVELKGNILFSELFPDGMIIDGGGAWG